MLQNCVTINSDTWELLGVCVCVCVFVCVCVCVCVCVAYVNFIGSYKFNLGKKSLHFYSW